MVSRSMKTTPAITCMKMLLSIFTGIVWVIGACLLGGGIYSKIDLSGYDLLTTTNFSTAPYVLIGIGVFMVLIGFFGCYSIGKGNTCMLRTFGFVLALIFFAEVALGLVVVVYRTKIHQSFNEGMMKAIANYDEPKYKDAVDSAQKTLKCCGSTNYTDYWAHDKSLLNTVPISCCRNSSICKDEKGWIVLPDAEDPKDYIYEEGCPAKVFEIVNSNLAVILGVVFGSAGFQLIGVILSCCLASNINANKYELV